MDMKCCGIQAYSRYRHRDGNPTDGTQRDADFVEVDCKHELVWREYGRWAYYPRWERLTVSIRTIIQLAGVNDPVMVPFIQGRWPAQPKVN